MDASSRRIRIWLVVSVAVAIGWLLVRDQSTEGAVVWAALVAIVARGASRAAVTGARPVLRGVVMVTVGVVSLGIGIGIAPPWFAKAGLSATSLAGAVLVGGGAALVVLGSRDVTARLRPMGMVLGGAGVVVLVGLTALTLSVAVAATNVPPTPIGETPADRAIDVVDVELVTEDGVVLAAWYVRSRNGAAVVLLHGAGSTRSSVVDHLEVLAANGYGVLAYDARGHGESSGRAMDFGWWGNWDAFPAIQWLVDRPEIEDDRIAVVGLSMGGEQAIGVAPFDGRVDAVVAEGATSRTAADKAWLSDVYGIRGRIQRILDSVRFGIADVLTETKPPIALRDAAQRMAPRPLLLITAGTVADERHSARHIRSGSPDSIEVWEVPGAGHTEGLEVAPAEWERRVIGFLDEALFPET